MRPRLLTLDVLTGCSVLSAPPAIPRPPERCSPLCVEVAEFVLTFRRAADGSIKFQGDVVWGQAK